MEIGDHTGSIQELINLTENLGCYDIYPDIHDHDDLGRYYIEELDAMQVPEHLRNYIDYEAYGRDIALEESGQFTGLGYVRDTGDSFHEYYDGERGSIPEEYRVMTFQDDIPEEEISEWAMDLAYDMDEFFRQHDPQYAAEHPEEHAAKEKIYENLMAGLISTLDEKLAALGQTQEDYLPSEIEKFKDATGYEEFLDVDPQAIREAIENPEQSHVDEMLSFAEQANREYEAELYGQQAAPTPDDRETGETVRTPRGTFHVTDMSREQMEAAGYGFHHESEDGKYLIMANGSRAFAIPSGAAPEHTPPEKLTVLVVEPMKEPYVKEIAPGLHALQAEVGGDIAASYPFDDLVGLVLNDEGKLIGLDLNRSLRDEHGEIYDIVAGTFLVVGLGPESFASLPPGHDPEVHRAIQAAGAVRQHQRADRVRSRGAGKPAEHGGNDPGGRLWDDRRDYQQRPPWGGIGESPGRGVQDHAEEKAFHPGAAGGRKAGVWVAKRPGQAHPAEEAPGAGRLMSRSKKWRLDWSFFLGENGRRQYNKLCKGCVHPCKQSFRTVVVSCPYYLSRRSKKRRN